MPRRRDCPALPSALNSVPLDWEYGGSGWAPWTHSLGVIRLEHCLADRTISAGEKEAKRPRRQWLLFLLPLLHLLLVLQEREKQHQVLPDVDLLFVLLTGQLLHVFVSHCSGKTHGWEGDIIQITSYVRDCHTNDCQTLRKEMAS